MSGTLSKYYFTPYNGAKITFAFPGEILGIGMENDSVYIRYINRPGQPFRNETFLCILDYSTVPEFTGDYMGCVTHNGQSFAVFHLWSDT